MTGFQLAIGVIAAVVLFLHGLQAFSKELQLVAGSAMRRWLARATSSRLGGMAVGAVATGIVQSSSAISAITVALVDSGILTFRASLGVMLGANIGSTTTAWLVSFKLTGIGPVFIVAGALLGLLPSKASVAGKAVFYFGFIFFALDLISAALQPLQASPAVQAWLATADNPWSGLVVGIAATVLLQSSSVVVGLAILLVQQGLLPAESAVPIVIGSNVGTTSTALVASLRLGIVARRSALANLLFNLGGLILVAPFLPWLARTVVRANESPAIAVASAHLYFNVGIAAVFLLVLTLMHRKLERFDSPPPAHGSTSS